ncbi:hypothetical protein CH380_07990 [Leptospira adleri]|uniref:Uncharacterized protein n=1 Tax=Leptospira adleri TaxID=2023186 RepID=A0A2M9YR06_9LEPT|nr:hypothetical protein CH380_07990 [Leptospira adleri]PJZ62018.1 hypothetical protein CH376_10195 [Leptospira adleri]
MRIFVGVPTLGTFYLQKVEFSDREKSPGAFLHPKLSAALSTDRLAGRGCSIFTEGCRCYDGLSLDSGDCG